MVTLAQGQFEAREILERCDGDAGCPTVGSERLRRLVPPRQRYGYDLIVHVGLARYLGGRQREEIRAELRDRHGIDLSDGTVSNLCDRFLLRLERLHLHRAPALRATMEGGYPLHLDATCEHGRGGLFVALDGWRGWVLGATRIPTEHQDHLQPLVDQVVALFGDPVAVVRDLGDGIGAAVEPLRQRGVPDLVCHYHFLAAVGKKLLEQPYSLLRDALRRTGVRSELYAMLRELRRHRQQDGGQRTFGPGPIREDLLALVLWLLEGDGHKDAPFPFSLPHLHLIRRCERAGEQAELWVPSPRTAPERRALQHLRSLLARLPKERGVAVATERLDEGWQAFCELRDVLRLTNAELPRADLRAEQPQLPSLELLRLAEMERDLLDYKQELDKRVAAAGKSSVHAVVLRYLQRHGGRLFGHPARRDEDGRVLAVVERTNNALEHFFGGRKQELRRRLGRVHLARDLQQQPAQAALVANLRHPDYVRVLYGSLDDLPDAFAELDGVAVASATPLVRDHRDHRLHRRIKRLVEGSTTAPEHAATETQPDPSSQPPSDIPQPFPDIEGLTEEQLRARCATVFAPARDPRLPPPGAILTRIWEGTEHQVLILDRGFDYQGQTYASLTAIARTVSGGRCTSGVNFFHLERLREVGEPKAAPRPAEPSYPLGPFSQRFREDLLQAGYGEATIRGYFGHVQRFANHHRRSPQDMGNVEVLQYLIHLVENRNVSLGSYRAILTALRACYTVSLKRPEEVEFLPARPEAVHQLAAHAAAPRSSAAWPVPKPAPRAHSEVVPTSATVS
ncbi:MAG: DUF2924 domain-containing protein [Actinobacteria bacterium]|nr:DUF2924 domain-containing protein [Actinomycetota bacterium]